MTNPLQGWRKKYIGDTDERHSRAAPALLGLSLLVSNALLWMTAPLKAGEILRMGHSATTAWAVLISFILTVVVAGQLYAHLIGKIARLRHQIGLHLTLWLLAATGMPIAGYSFAASPGDTEPARVFFSLLPTLSLPLLFLAANAPLVQLWYARTNGRSSQDPYFLFGTTLIGAIAGLLIAPLIDHIPRWSDLSFFWECGFIALGAFLFLAVLNTTREHPDARNVMPITDMPTDMFTLWSWLAISFTAAVLPITIADVTFAVSDGTDWVWPWFIAAWLAGYLAAFQTRNLENDRVGFAAYPISIALLSLLVLAPAGSEPSIAPALLALTPVALAVLTLHRMLYRMRPDQSRLTLFYLAVSSGSAAGGIFAALLAPGMLVAPIEAHLALIAAAAVVLIPNRPQGNFLTGFLILGCLVLLMAPLLRPELTAGLLKPLPMILLTAAGAAVMMIRAYQPLAVLLISLPLLLHGLSQ